ncbi:MAG TPA: sulfite oxidase [Burkholderiales bacterium]|nr:sulfite oxidase [Burkholderiales bacterium]
MAANPFFGKEPRPHVEGDFAREELALACRNSALPLEALACEVTPVGLHYTLSHFDVPLLDDAAFRLAVGGLVTQSLALALADIRRLPARTLRVTMECAGNGRGLMSPRYPSMPWLYEGVSTAEWTGTPLRYVLEQAGLRRDAVDIAFVGADRGFDRGVEHDYGRSLKPADALADDVLLAYAMNGAPLLPQHGFPLRLVVPGWFGMASVKWLTRIAVLDRPYDGLQQAVGYHYRKYKGDPGVPITHAKVKSLMVPPGIPDWYTRRRLLERGAVALAGRAWSGAGAPIARVEIAVDGAWRDAIVEPQRSRFAWQGWGCDWDASPGEHDLACRATDSTGATQPLEPEWNTNGMGNNAVHRLQVTVR